MAPREQTLDPLAEGVAGRLLRSPLAQPRGLSLGLYGAGLPLRGKWLETRTTDQCQSWESAMKGPLVPTVSHCHLIPSSIPKVPKWERMSKGKDEWESGAGEGRGRVPSLSRNHMAQPPHRKPRQKTGGPSQRPGLYSFPPGPGLQGTSLSLSPVPISCPLM